MRRALPCSLFAIALAGCALAPAPDAEQARRESLPNTAVPGQWTGAAVPAGAALDGWLATFADEKLQALVLEALAFNPDLQSASARVEQAAAFARQAGATLYPQVGLMARGGGKMSGDSSGLQGVGVSAGWEIDLWGRVRASREAAVLQLDSTALEAWYARQSIAALVAKGWFLATEARMQKALAEEMLRSSQSLVSLAVDRQRIGPGDEYDIALARTNVQTFRDAIEQLDLAHRQAQRSLEVLAGRYPAALLDAPAQLAPKPPPVPAGLPSELLARRPDVVAAERRLAAAFYRVEEAQAARLPQISLTLSGTSVSSDLLVLKDHSNPVWSAGLKLLAPLFTAGALEAQVEIRTAEQKAALADYGRVGAKAFSEVENALSSEFTLAAREAVLRQAVVDNERALELAGTRYRVGSADFRAVQQQQLAVYAARTALLRVRSEQLVQRVNLHLALGGGWSVAETVALPTPAK